MKNQRYLTKLRFKQRKSKYFIYIITADAGSAPNPFHRFCTLAICKPEIRKAAQKGDWVIGLYSQAKSKSQKYSDRLIYAMEVTKKVSFDEYWKNKKFAKKKPSKKSAKEKCGDNIYHKNLSGQWIQKKGSHHNEKNINGDTKRDAVLISSNFFYLGKECIHIPKNIKESINKSWRKKGHKTLIDQIGRSHKYLDEISGKLLVRWLKKTCERKGRHGDPISYKDDDKGCRINKIQNTC